MVNTKFQSHTDELGNMVKKNRKLARIGWKAQLQAIIDANNTMKLSGRGNTSYRTRKARAQNLFSIFKTLIYTLNMKIENPKNIKVKHVEALVKYWHESGNKPSTIDMNLSYLRMLCKWLGKDDMVKSMSEYLPGVHRIYAAQEDKSFTGNQIDFWEVWQAIYEKDAFVGMQVLAIKAFGLRQKEAMMMKPLIADHGQYLTVYDGAKGGRPRIIPIDDIFKQSVVAALKNFVLERNKSNVKAHLGHADKNLEQNMQRYSYVLRCCGVTKVDLGVTGHGLRTEFVIDELVKRGVIPTIRGGSGKADTKIQTKSAKLQVMEMVGHSRESVLAAYSGAMIIKRDDRWSLYVPEESTERELSPASKFDLELDNQ